MRELVALFRAGWLSAASYRLNLFFSLLGLGLMLVPVYFVTNALQPVAEASIRAEGREYFGFVAVGLAVLFLVSTALTGLPNAIGGGIASGTLESLLATPVPLPALLLGVMSFDLGWSLLRGMCLLLAAHLLGVSFHLAGAPWALAALGLVVLSYAGVGLGLAAMILLFRTIGPLAGGIIAASSLLGGVYYSTTVIPSWVQQLSVIVPLTYGLRVLRQALLLGAGFSDVRADLLALTLLASVLFLAGALCFRAALHRARRQGSLGQY